jgi:hypothetical protein
MIIQESKEPIPKIFHSFDGIPFERCIECDSFLLDGHIDYFIEKAMKSYDGFNASDVIFEYAICTPCAMEFHSRMSEESIGNITEFMQSRTRFAERQEVIKQHPDDPVSWMNMCMITGEQRINCTEYQVFAHCRGDKLIVPTMPYMISGTALDQMSELLSNKTLDEMDGFIGKHFGPPGEFESSPTRKVILI